MHDQGFNTVKLWCCWSWMNPEPGRFDFDDIDELMDLAAKHELAVVLNTILENCPYWLEARHPEARYVDNEDRPVPLAAAMNTPGGGWPGLCFDNDHVWEAAQQFLAALTARYGEHGALSFWDVWNRIWSRPHISRTAGTATAPHRRSGSGRGWSSATAT
jgi:beta-galactosidase